MGTDLGMHVHFTLDFDAHHHVLGPDARREIAGFTGSPADETVMNYPDGSVGYSGPYDPTDGPSPANKFEAHWLAKSFRPAGTLSIPTYAPSDLRIDGGYSERHAAPAYYTHKGGQSIWKFNDEPGSGMASFWVKPSFAPELAGKVRMFWDLSRYHTPCYKEGYIMPWAMWFFPAHYNNAEGSVPGYIQEAFGSMPPSSIVWGFLNIHDVNPKDQQGGWLAVGGFGNMTTTLNHLDHGATAWQSDGQPSPLRAHRWVNFTFTWDCDLSKYKYHRSFLYTNGAVTPWCYGDQQTTLTPAMATWEVGWSQRLWYFDRHDEVGDGDAMPGTGDFNHMRLGGPSRIADSIPDVPYRNNHAADATFDEFYVWKTVNDPQALWRRGRYYNPATGSGTAVGSAINPTSECTFTSQQFSLQAGGSRNLAPGSAVPAPAVPGAAVPSSTVVGASGTAARVIGMAWTWYGEGLDPATGKATLYDYNTLGGATPLGDVKPKVGVGLKDGGTVYPCWEDGFSKLTQSNGTIPVLSDPTQLRYVVQLRLEDVDVSSILLATPVVDDVTIYWDNPQMGLVSYVFENRSF
jgi:hypothetical protein